MQLMEHPEHGRTHAYSQAQIDSNLENGWNIVEDKKVDIKELRKQYFNKFGKKPYHGKTAEKLIEELG